MQLAGIFAALARPPEALGILPDLASLRPKLQIHLYPSLPSTNQQAWQLIDQGHGAGTVVIAVQQTAGRGQWGRTWVSAQGGLYLSLVLEPEIPATDSAWLTLSSAWGVATGLSNLGIPIQIKWPNDLVSQGRKVGGILTESRLSRIGESAANTEADRPLQVQQAVVGLGLNWDNPLPPQGLSLRPLLPDCPSPPVKSLEDLAAIALRGLLQGYYYWQLQGTTALMLAYQQKLAHQSKKINPDGHSGTVKGVSSTGDLVVEMNQGDREQIRFFKPGEISLGYNV